MPYTSPRKRARILLLRKTAASLRSIANDTGVPKSTVEDIVKKHFKTDECYLVKAKSGRPRIFGPADSRLAARELLTLKCRDATEVQRTTFPHVSPHTVRRALKAQGLNAYRPRKKPLLTEKNMAKRREWAGQHDEWSEEDWGQVIFSDESKFNLVGSDGHRVVWRKPGEELDPRFVNKTVKHGGGNVMVWGCVTQRGVGRLHRIDGIMDSALYIEILKETYLGTLKDHGIKVKEVYFQQDGDPKHRSKMTSEWIKKKRIDLLPWAPSSPDMNIIEHVWDHLDKKVRSRKNLPRNRNEFWEALEEEWYAIDVEYIKGLYASMPRRVQALKEAQGGYTKY